MPSCVRRINDYAHPLFVAETGLSCGSSLRSPYKGCCLIQKRALSLIPEETNNIKPFEKYYL